MKNCQLLINELIRYFSEELECFCVENILVLNTPFVYSDGDHIQLFIQQFEDIYLISDLGETARKMDIFDFNWNTKQAKILYNHILNSLDIESDNHILQFKTQSLEGIGQKVFNLIHAIQRKENLLITKKYVKPKKFQAIVEEYLISEGFSLESEYKVIGDSGREHSIDLFINHNSNILINALSTQSEKGDNDQISRTYVAYSDIHINHPLLKRTIILDDSETEWDGNQINLISQVTDANIGIWSRKELFSKELHSLVV